MGYLRPAEPVLTAEIVIALPPYPATSSRAAEMGDPHLCFLAKPGTEAAPLDRLSTDLSASAPSCPRPQP